MSRPFHVLLSVLILVAVCGCPKGKQTGAEQTSKGTAANFDGVPIPLDGPDVFIESVPAGAEVYLEPTDDGKKAGEGSRNLGKTPLRLRPAECASMRFHVRITVDDFLTEVDKKIPMLKGWVARVRSDRYFGLHNEAQFFDFGAEAVQTSQFNLQNMLINTGPVIDLKYQKENRLCVLFVPNGYQSPVLLPLMPEAGRFAMPADQIREILTRDHQFEKRSAELMTDTLLRCGTASWAVADRGDRDTEKVLTMSIQGERGESLVITTRSRQGLANRPTPMVIGEVYTDDGFIKSRARGGNPFWDRDHKPPKDQPPRQDVIIDSIPAGAEVYLMPRVKDGGKTKSLGKTPLVVNSQNCPGFRFGLEMKFDDYLRHIESAYPNLPRMGCSSP